MNYYLTLDVYYNGIIDNTLKSIYIFDFKSKKTYCGKYVLGSAYDDIYQNDLNSTLNCYPYVIPINDLKKLKILMKIDTTKFLYHNIKKFLKEYDLEEWLI